jgi:hypothetical protein
MYPQVVDERETLIHVLAGRSLARYGDGEFKICDGHGCKSNPLKDEVMSARMRDILWRSGDCLVGVPNIRSDTPKAEFWGKFMAYAKYYDPARRYCSSFVTRPDSAPWIDTDEYWAMIESLWIGQDVTLVRGSGKSLVSDDLVGARSVTEIIGPRQNAWFEYDSLMERIGTPKRALLCLGPTATIMAVDLCAKGVHAIDCGHCGMFLRKHRRGEPMWLSKEDKEAVL